MSLRFKKKLRRLPRLKLKTIDETKEHEKLVKKEKNNLQSNFLF